ncbi:dysbindin-A-like isoform X2 [Girardinichthys multiradiatus]|uniref:dysbindin-A-like isoform X2 n=1 Tax=Girardinichthys multiradiatus TaxID=208333 RepID=UPI001FADEA3B|nr:dysbindin-A-like isoform X2 [Girardinichthys multiradiatus]XP_047217696.1 dysbindin-A-like isoform X2 [Girardinichthys multiradiatus]XP_047217697.1 dysbindin-A-like isoform X2 [Girardinichthys multiradiatus]
MLTTATAVKISFKTLGDIKDTKIKKSRLEEGFPYLGAGLEILNRFEKSWFLLHKRTKDCAQVAESVDGDIVMLSAHLERGKAVLINLQEQLQSLPDFITELDAITANIANLEGEFEEMESRLLYLETLCCQCEQQTVKNQHKSQLEGYKKKRRREVEMLEAELNSEHAQKMAEMELAMQEKLRERQRVYEEAFNQDVEKYLSTGCLQGRGSAGVDVAILDQMTLINLSDQEALDDFLNSTGEDTSSGSSLTSGPDLKSSSLESLNQVPPTNNSQSSQVAVWQEEAGASEDGEEPRVQSDEEDVQADMSLIAVLKIGRTLCSDESDSAGDNPSE